MSPALEEAVAEAYPSCQAEEGVVVVAAVAALACPCRAKEVEEGAAAVQVFQRYQVEEAPEEVAVVLRGVVLALGEAEAEAGVAARLHQRPHPWLV